MSGETQGNFAKTKGEHREFGLLKFPDSKGKEYCDTWHDNFNVFLEAGYICQVR